MVIDDWDHDHNHNHDHGHYHEDEVHDDKNVKVTIFFKSDPYVRILMFNGSGRLVKKKKTTVKVRGQKKKN